MNIIKQAVTITGSTDGATSYSAPVNGVLRRITYTRSTAAPISTTATLTITAENSGAALFTSTVTGAGWSKMPTASAINTTGGAITNSYAFLPLADERIKVAIGVSTASSQTGTLSFYIEGR